MALVFGSTAMGSFSANALVERQTTARSLPKLVPSSEGKEAKAKEAGSDFGSALLNALDGVNKDQVDASGAIETFLVDPDSIEAHDVTVAMAKANMSLNITRTVLDRVVRAWKDIINTR